MAVMEGKLPPELLEDVVLSRLECSDERVVVGPRIGEDAAILDLGDRFLVVHSDPITGAVERIGWYAAMVASNDVATRGARPAWLLPVILCPVGKVEMLEKMVEDIREAASTLNACVVGGHTEFTPGIRRPIISMTAMGYVEREKLVVTSRCEPGDSIILTKGAGIEGTAILAAELEDLLRERLGEDLVRKAKEFSNLISIVDEAMTAVDAGEVHAMHDPTEGGVACGLQELAIASGRGVVAYEDSIIINPETAAIAGELGIDPLRLISSGSLLIVAGEGSEEGILNALESRGVKASIIGKITEDPSERAIIRKDGSRLDLTGPISDELWRALKKMPR